MTRIRYGSPQVTEFASPCYSLPRFPGASSGGVTTMRPPAMSTGHEGGGERHHDGRSAGPWPQFQDITGAESVDRRDRADLGAVGGDGAKSDEIGVVELVGRRRRQTLARNEQPEIGEPLRRAAIADAAKARNQMTLGRAQRLDLEARRAVFGRK